MNRLVLLMLGFCLATTHGLAQQTKAPQKPAKEVFSGTMIGIGGTFGGASRSFTLTITGQTSDEEALELRELLRSKGQMAVLSAVSKKDLGRFSPTGEVGRQLNVVRIHETPEGRVIKIGFDRWENMYELRNGTRSRDYPFTYIEIFVDNQGKGEGSLVAAAKVYFDKKDKSTLNIESYGIYPAKLAGVRLETK